MKKLIVTILISLLLISCGTRKTQSSISEVKKDSITSVVVNQESKSQEKEKDTLSISYDVSEEEISITPIDTSKAMSVNGKIYKNVKLTVKKKQDKTTLNSASAKTKEKSEKLKVKASSEVKIKEKSKEKGTERNSISWLWFLIILPVAGVIFYLYRKQKPSPLDA